MPLDNWKPLSAADWAGLELKNPELIVETLAPFYETRIEIRPLEQYSQNKFQTALKAIGCKPSSNHNISINSAKIGIETMSPILAWGAKIDFPGFTKLENLLLEYVINSKVLLMPESDASLAANRGIKRSGLWNAYGCWTELHRHVEVRFKGSTRTENGFHVGAQFIEILELTVELIGTGALAEAKSINPFLELFLAGNIPFGITQRGFATQAILLTV